MLAIWLYCDMALFFHHEKVYAFFNQQTQRLQSIVILLLLKKMSCKDQFFRNISDKA